MTVITITDKGSWDRFIDESPYGLLYHKWDFLKVIEKNTGYTLIPYGIYRGEELVCVFPAFLKKSNMLEFVYSPGTLYVPYLGFAMGPVYDALKQRRKESYINFIVDEMNEEIGRISPNYVSISTVPGFKDVRPFIWNGYDVRINYTYVIDLDRPIEDIWKGFDKTCRQTINNCAKHKLSIVQSSDVDGFFGFMRTRLSDRGLTHFHKDSPQYVKDLLSAFPDNIKMYNLYSGDEIIGVLLNSEYKNRVLAWMGAAVIQKDIDANEYLFWEMIKKAHAEGYKEFENWGADEERLNGFKTKFNPRLDYTFSIQKKDHVGRLVESAYRSVSKRAYLNSIRKKLFA